MNQKTGKSGCVATHRRRWKSDIQATAVASLLILFSFCLTGCVHPRQSAHRATDINPKQAKADFWLAKPAVASVTAANYQHLWDAADRAARDHRFEIDQNDRRLGVMTTLPLSSKQLWEIWRNDVPHLKDQFRSTLAEYRQIIHFDFQHLPNGDYKVVPKVVVERHAQKQRRVTAVVNYNTVFSPDTRQNDDFSADQPRTPGDYWYATGRDYGLERELAHEIQKRVR